MEMTTPTSPAGWQNVTCGVVQEGDWLIGPLYSFHEGWFAQPEDIGTPVENIDSGTRVYRKMPVPKQGDCDTSGWKSVQQQAVFAKEIRTASVVGFPDYMTKPEDAKARKAIPAATGVLDYFPDAILALAVCSRKGNEQHNPGQPLHWSRGKSSDHADALIRHFLERGKVDSDGVPHSVKVAWRALAIAQLELEGRREDTRAND